MDKVVFSAFFKPIFEKSINGGSSLISDQLLKYVFREENRNKYQMTLNNLALQLGMTRDLPITEAPRRHNLKILKDEYKKRKDLLDSPGLLDFIKSLFSDNVQDTQWFVDQAKDLLSFANQIRQNPGRMPLVKQLITREGLYISYTARQGSQKGKCYIWPFFLEERGVEAALQFQYSDSIIPGKSFTMELFLRLRESTDLVGIAIRCLKLIPSQLKLVRETAKCELDQLSKLCGDFSSHENWNCDPLVLQYMATTVQSRPDSFCCAADADADGKLPEEISYFNFNCHVGGAVNGNVTSSPNGISPISPLEVNLTFVPHLSRALLGRKEEQEVSSVQQFLENIGQNATENLIHQQEFTSHICFSIINHGFVRVEVKKPTI